MNLLEVGAALAVWVHCRSRPETPVLALPEQTLDQDPVVALENRNGYALLFLVLLARVLGEMVRVQASVGLAPELAVALLLFLMVLAVLLNQSFLLFLHQLLGQDWGL